MKLETFIIEKLKAFFSGKNSADKSHAGGSAENNAGEKQPGRFKRLFFRRAYDS